MKKDVTREAAGNCQYLYGIEDKKLKLEAVNCSKWVAGVGTDIYC